MIVFLELTKIHLVPNPDGKETDGFKFDRLGVRVPTLLISPWVEKGGVIHAPNGPAKNSEYEHSSIPATIKKVTPIYILLPCVR